MKVMNEFSFECIEANLPTFITVTTVDSERMIHVAETRTRNIGRRNQLLKHWKLRKGLPAQATKAPNIMKTAMAVYEDT